MEKTIYSENLLKHIVMFKKNHDDYKYETCFFKLYHCDKDKFNVSYGTACHYNLKYYNIGGSEEAYILDGLQEVPNKGAKNYNTYRRYVDYIINRSPLRKVFLENDLDYVMDNKLTISTIDLNCDYTACALTALRMSSEHGSRVSKTWARMVDIGVNEDVAFMLSHCLKWDWNVFIREDMSWHTPIAGNEISIDVIVDFITMLDHFDIQREKTRHCSYNNMNRFFYRGRRADTSKFLSEFYTKQRIMKSFFSRTCEFSKSFPSLKDLKSKSVSKNGLMRINNAVLEKLGKEKK